MPRDYKNRAAPSSSSAARASCWTWFAAGLMTGLFIGGVAWLKVGPETLGNLGLVPENPASAPAQKISEPKAPNAEQTPPKPRFAFYDILPEMEVLVPDGEVDKEVATAKPTVVPPKAAVKEPQNQTQPEGPRYMLQMGSFRKHADADRLKARLALMGIEANIQRVTINNKDTFHRVRSGPYQKGRQLNDIRARLKNKKITPLVIRIKG